MKTVIVLMLVAVLGALASAGVFMLRKPKESDPRKDRMARALAVRPRLLLLDEPLSALDRDLRERLAADLRSILTRAGTTALLVTHDHDEAFAVADRMALLRAAGELEDLPYRVTWSTFTSGPPLLGR